MSITPQPIQTAAELGLMRGFGAVTYRNRAGAEFSFDDMVEMSCSDGSAGAQEPQ